MGKLTKEQFIDKWCNCKLYFPMLELNKFITDLDQLIKDKIEECAEENSIYNKIE